MRMCKGMKKLEQLMVFIEYYDERSSPVRHPPLKRVFDDMDLRKFVGELVGENEMIQGVFIAVPTRPSFIWDR